jgi:hypothetical protein
MVQGPHSPHKTPKAVQPSEPLKLLLLPQNTSCLAAEKLCTTLDGNVGCPSQLPQGVPHIPHVRPMRPSCATSGHSAHAQTCHAHAHECTQLRVRGCMVLLER